MATKKVIWVLFGILVISAWVLGSAIQAGAETLKFRVSLTETKILTMPVNDVEGHILGLQTMEGLAFLENGEIARVKQYSAFDYIPGKGSQSFGYSLTTFEDGSTIEGRSQNILVPDQSGTFSYKRTTEAIKGTGRFEGIKGTSSSTRGKLFERVKGGPLLATTDVTMTYTLPPK